MARGRSDPPARGSSWRALALLFPPALALAIGAGPARAAAEGSAFPGATWPTSTPEQQGIDAASLQRMLEDIQRNDADVDGVLVVRHGFLVFEGYRAPYDAGTAHNMKSSSKSVLSALVGIALRERVLDGVDQPVSELFPEHFARVDDERKKDLTLRHLLTMTAGLEWEENAPRSDRLWASQDWVGEALALPLTAAPGERFTYSTALTHLASAAIARRSGMSTRAFAERHLFGPVGIRAGLWRRDPRGIERGGFDLFLTPRDMARFGYLYLRGGAWDGRQVVPREWVEQSTRAQVKTGGRGGFDAYGYWWWIDPQAYVAVGLGGQVIAVVPDQDLVVVFTAAGPASVPFDLFRRYIAPALRPGRLPPNAAAARALAGLQRDLEHPPRLQDPPVPAAAARLSDRAFRLDPNPFGFTGLQLRCAIAERCSIALEVAGQTTILPVGLGGRYQVTRTAAFSDVPVACKGAWVDADAAHPTFLLSLVQVGDPTRNEARFTFDGDRVSVLVRRRSAEVETIRLAGRAAPAP